MKKVIPIVIILILLLVIKNNTTTILRTLENKNTASLLTKELASEEKKGQFLKEKLFYVKTNKFVEEEAREKLGMVKGGEYIVIAPTSTPLNHEKITIDNDPNWKKWWKLFF